MRTVILKYEYAFMTLILIRKTLFYKKHGSDVTVQKYRDYVYDERGILIKEGKALYEYFSLGNMFRKTRLDAEPTIQRMKYIYE